jgi:hypothetical protein
MKKRSITPNNKPERPKHERDPIPWRYCLLTLICGLILVGGFFWAARQHFSAMDYGIKNAKLRQSKNSLESEQRRLYLTKEISLSTDEIKKAAKKIGLQDLTARSFEMVSFQKSPDSSSTAKPTNDKSKQSALTKIESDKPAAKGDKDNKVKDKNGVEKVDTKQMTSTLSNSTGSVTRARIAKK